MDRFSRPSEIEKMSDGTASGIGPVVPSTTPPDGRCAAKQVCFEGEHMTWKKKPLDNDSVNRIVSEARRDRQKRLQGYRERALKLYPWVCARCGRDFQGKKLRELTVHHKDHDHDNNPPDGSNWELLCLYCHDNEHSRYTDQSWYDAEAPGGETKPIASDRPFAGLDTLLKAKK
jgi:hypothetical protein